MASCNAVSPSESCTTGINISGKKALTKAFLAYQVQARLGTEKLKTDVKEKEELELKVPEQVEGMTLNS